MLPSSFVCTKCEAAEFVPFFLVWHVFSSQLNKKVKGVKNTYFIITFCPHVLCITVGWSRIFNFYLPVPHFLVGKVNWCCRWHFELQWVDFDHLFSKVWNNPYVYGCPKIGRLNLKVVKNNNFSKVHTPIRLHILSWNICNI